MNKIKKQISDLRKTTPRHIQWLLMAAAFVVVIILLTMIIGGKKDANDDEIDAKNGEQLQLFIEPENLDWSETPVGTTEEKKIIITASAPVKVIKVRRTSDIQGLSIDENCSTSTVTLDKKQACAITVKYAPTAAMKPTGTAVYIDWHGARESANMKQDARITMVLGAVGDAQKSEQKPEQKSAPQPAPAPAPKPLPEPEPIVEPVAEPEPDPVPDEEPAPIIEEMRRDIELITPSDSSLF
ncbi:hypothetical protein HDR66_00050, partial [bacterium]|nr:hypothetical protein [bacterium]